MGNKVINVQGQTINIKTIGNEDYISLTDMVSNHEAGASQIESWLRNKNTIEYLGAWEVLSNPNFNSLEFEGIKNEAGSNRFYISAKKWIEKTNAIGIQSSAGRYGGTLAHKDIAFNFGMWISPIFQLFIVKEYQRLKDIETNVYGLEWNVKRVLSKANYHIHTDAVKKYIVPKAGYSKAKEWLLYADEADLLNVVLFGCTAKDWRESNPEKHLNGENIRDMASINELSILQNIEGLNATLIKNNVSKKDRFRILSETVKDQKETLDKIDIMKSIKKISPSVYIDEKKNDQPKLSDFNNKLKQGLNWNPKQGKK